MKKFAKTLSGNAVEGRLSSAGRKKIIIDVGMRDARLKKVHIPILGTCFLYKQHFYKQRQAEIGIKSSKVKQHAEAELFTGRK